MEDEFIFWAHHTPIGIKVEEVFGLETSRPGKLWREMAEQVFCEHGIEGYREIGHFRNGAPFIFGLDARVSITHTSNFYAAAFLPKTPEADLGTFSPRTAMGIDAESFSRSQVLKIRERFLSGNELEMIPEDDVAGNIIAWTCKEAAYKAAMTEGLDFRTQIRIEKLPATDKKVSVPHDAAPLLGDARLVLPGADGEESFNLRLYNYESEGTCVTIAFSPQCAKFGKH